MSGPVVTSCSASGPKVVQSPAVAGLTPSANLVKNGATLGCRGATFGR